MTYWALFHWREFQTNGEFISGCSLFPSKIPGRRKVYERIAGNLIAHAAKIAVADYAELACVSLRPKSQLVHHYMAQYNMILTGMTLSIEVPEILELIKRYDHD
jgi:Na+-translocating ferredoxin:NAD+ oxidoreductase RnfD subunit